MTHRVMLIDDSEADLLFARIMMQRSGMPYDVETYESARDALQALRDGSAGCDIILLDINMPGMSGYEFLDAYQQLCAEKRACAVVVMLTSSPDPSDRERALAYDCVKGYVTKPIDMASVRSLVDFIGH